MSMNYGSLTSISLGTTNSDNNNSHNSDNSNDLTNPNIIIEEWFHSDSEEDIDRIVKTIHKNDRTKYTSIIRVFVSIIIITLASLLSIMIYENNTNVSDIFANVMSSNNNDIESNANGISGSAYSEAYKALLETDMKFTLTRNGYKALDMFSGTAGSYIKYQILDGYDAIIEPFAQMNLEVVSGASELLSYQYLVCPTTSSESGENCYQGSLLYDSNTNQYTQQSVSIPCDPYNQFTMTVTLYTIDTNTPIKAYTQNALCLYVRREIRTLTSDDLSDAMDAMYALWDLDEDHGQQTYGSEFHSSSYFSEMHNFNSAWQDSDHIHEGLGFFPQHLKMSTIFERAVQAVDPSFSLPYWDYSIEESEGETILDSTIFTASTFGSLTAPYNDEDGWTYKDNSFLGGAIPDGRWAYVKADKNDRYSDLQGGFGYLRGPWNMNPSPYVTRFPTSSGSLPGCVTFYNLLKYDDLMDFLAVTPYDSHASTHGSIGGVFGCDLFDDLLDSGYINDNDDKISLCGNWGFYIKELYRANYLKPQTDCTYSDDAGNDFTCGYTCNSDYDEVFASKLETIINSDYLPNGQLDKEGWAAWKDFICEGDGYKVFTGDHLESASPADPSFWVIHPTQERLYHVKMMTGGFINTTWPTDQMEDFVCSKAICYEESEGDRDSYDSCCYGHFQYDQLLDWVHADKGSGYGLTNDDILQASDPTSSKYTMGYVYDSFSWPHCSSAGYDFEIALETLYVSDGTDIIFRSSNTEQSELERLNGVSEK